MLKRLPLATDRAMLAAPFLFVLLWSSSFITTKVGLRHISPLLFVAIRLVVCAIVLTVVMLLLRARLDAAAGYEAPLAGCGELRREPIEECSVPKAGGAKLTVLAAPPDAIVKFADIVVPQRLSP